MTTTCTVAHYRDPDRPRRTVDGYTICGGCATGISNQLDTLPKLHNDLTYLHGTRRMGGEQTKISGSTGARLPIALGVAAARADLQDTIAKWTTHAVRHAQADGVISARQWRTLDVASGAGWLRFNIDWCTRQEWAPHLATAIRRVHSRAWRLLDPRPRRFFAIPGDDGLCIRHIDGAPCSGRMWVTIPENEEQSSTIMCDTCEHVYAPTSWLRLGKLVHARKAAA